MSAVDDEVGAVVDGVVIDLDIDVLLLLVTLGDVVVGMGMLVNDTVLVVDKILLVVETLEDKLIDEDDTMDGGTDDGMDGGTDDGDVDGDGYG
jgi:hypothetical protein